MDEEILVIISEFQVKMIKSFRCLMLIKYFDSFWKLLQI